MATSSLLEINWPRTDDREMMATAELDLIPAFLGFLAFVPTLGTDFVARDDPAN